MAILSAAGAGILVVSRSGQSGFTLTGNRNRSSIFAFVAFSDGKPDSTFPENALFARIENLGQPAHHFGRSGGGELYVGVDLLGGGGIDVDAGLLGVGFEI